MQRHKIEGTNYVFVINSLEHDRIVGTCFGYQKSGILLTAAHVVRGLKIEELKVLAIGPSGYVWPIESIKYHDTADVAAIYIQEIKQNTTPSFFSDASPPDGFIEFPRGESVISVGYPQFANDEAIIGRMMSGRIQAEYPYKSEPYEYRAFELPFPAFPGQSGSAVLRADEKTEAIAIVTESITYSSELNGEVTQAHWTIAASFTPLKGWIDTL